MIDDLFEHFNMQVAPHFIMRFDKAALSALVASDSCQAERALASREARGARNTCNALQAFDARHALYDQPSLAWRRS